MAREPQDNKKLDLKLPPTVVGLVDLGRLQREVEAVEVFVAQAAARQAGKAVAMPRTTRNLESLCQHNKINLLVNGDRRALANFLVEVRNTAPRVHISFASDPSAAFMQKIVAWFRSAAHPLTIVQVGLQPNLAAGCTLRTSSKYFDLSLRRDFDKHKEILLKKIRDTRLAPAATTQPVAAPKSSDKPAAELREYSFSPPKPTATAVAPTEPEKEIAHG